MKPLAYISKLLFYPLDKFKSMKPVQKLPFVIFAIVFLYYWIFDVIKWDYIIGYTLILLIGYIVISLIAGIKLLDEPDK